MSIILQILYITTGKADEKSYDFLFFDYFGNQILSNTIICLHLDHVKGKSVVFAEQTVYLKTKSLKNFMNNTLLD